MLLEKKKRRKKKRNTTQVPPTRKQHIQCVLEPRIWIRECHVIGVWIFNSTTTKQLIITVFIHLWKEITKRAALGNKYNNFDVMSFQGLIWYVKINTENFYFHRQHSTNEIWVYYWKILNRHLMSLIYYSNLRHAREKLDHVDSIQGESISVGN